MERKILVVLALGALTACGGGTATPDSGSVRDTGPRPDTGVVTDTGPAVDTGPRVDTGPGTDSGVALDCATYCSMQLSTCATMEAQYADMASCMGSCAAFALGTVGDTTGNTLACRLYHTMAAASMAGAEHCLHAGPTGFGLCGPSQCEAFCQIAALACTGANEQWATAAECMTDCDLYMGSTPGPGEVDYSITQTSGDTFACRMYHLTVASSSAALADVHCGHIALVSATCN